MSSYEKPVTWRARCPNPDCDQLASFTARPPMPGQASTLTIHCDCNLQDSAPGPASDSRRN